MKQVFYSIVALACVALIITVGVLFNGQIKNEQAVTELQDTVKNLEESLENTKSYIDTQGQEHKQNIEQIQEQTKEQVFFSNLLQNGFTKNQRDKFELDAAMHQYITKNFERDLWCLRQFDQTAEPQMYEYVNEEFGFRASLPHSNEWASEHFELAPYMELPLINDDLFSLSFGKIGNVEGCTWSREAIITVLPKQSLDAVIEDAFANVAKQQHREIPLEDRFVRVPEIITLENGQQAAAYVYDGMCGGGGLFISGPAYTYKVSSICGYIGEADLQVANSITFIE